MGSWWQKAFLVCWDESLWKMGAAKAGATKTALAPLWLRSLQRRLAAQSSGRGGMGLLSLTLYLPG